MSYVPEEEKQNWIKSSDFARKYIPIWERCLFQINPKSIHNRFQSSIKVNDRKKIKNNFVYKTGALEKAYINYTKKFFRCPPDSNLKTFFPFEKLNKLSGDYISTLCHKVNTKEILWGLICQEIPKLIVSFNEELSLYHPYLRYYKKEVFSVPVGISYYNLYYQDSPQSNIIWNTENYVTLQFNTGINLDLLSSLNMNSSEIFNFLNSIIKDTLAELITTNSIKFFFQPTEDFKILNILILKEDLKVYCDYIEKHFKENLEAFYYFNPSQKKGKDCLIPDSNEEEPKELQVVKLIEEEPKPIDCFDELVNNIEKHTSELIVYKNEAEKTKKELNLLTNKINELENIIKELQFSLNKVQKNHIKPPKTLTLFGFKIKKERKKTIANSGLDKIEF